MGPTRIAENRITEMRVFVKSAKLPKTQQASSKIVDCQADGGKSPPKPKLKYRQLDERIRKVTEKHVHGDMMRC